MKFVIIAAAILMFSTRTFAHEAPTGWSYPMACCSGQDCQQVQDKEIGTTRNGYVIRKTGEFLPFGDARLKESPDGGYHWCAPQFGSQITICLFVPPLGY